MLFMKCGDIFPESLILCGVNYSYENNKCPSLVNAPYLLNAPAWTPKTGRLLILLQYLPFLLSLQFPLLIPAKKWNKITGYQSVNSAMELSNLVASNSVKTVLKKKNSSLWLACR